MYNLDTKKGRYFAGLNSDFVFPETFNTQVEVIHKSYVAITDDSINEIYAGSGCLNTLKTKDAIYYLIITAAHVLKAIGYNKKLKVPLNYDFCPEWHEQAQCMTLFINENNSTLITDVDLGIISGVNQMKDYGYQYQDLTDNAVNLKVNDKIILVGINENRVIKAEKQARALGSKIVGMYYFNFITRVSKIEYPFFYIKYPAEIWTRNPSNEMQPMKSRIPESDGFSGTTLYTEINGRFVKAGIFLSKKGNEIKCLSYQYIAEIING